MIKTDARIDVSSPNASKMSCISNTINNRSRGNDNRRGGWGRVIKMAVIIPFPIYRPNKIMRIDAVSEDIRPDPRIYILLKVTAADGGGHKSRIPPILRVYRPVCRRRCGTNDADAIRGHLVARMQEAKHAAKRDFVPSFPPLHPSTGLDNVQSRPSSALSLPFPQPWETTLFARDRIRISRKTSIYLYPVWQIGRKIETTRSLFSRSGKEGGRKLGKGERRHKIIIDRFK